MPVQFQCPHCGKTTTVADEYIGQSGPCASCGETVTIPDPNRAAPPKPGGGSSTMTVVVVVLIVVLGMFACGGAGLVALLLPAVQASREAARRMQCSNNLKQLALAVHNYADTHGALPPAYTVDADGNKLHSWRTLLLPYLDQQPLYEQIDLDKPWDAPENAAFADMQIPVFRCASSLAPPSSTNYMAVVGPGGIFEGPNQVGFRDITDGTSNTLLFVEVESNTSSWMEPVDLDLETLEMAINQGSGMGSNHPGGMNAAMADGSVRFISETVASSVLEALMTRNGGEVVGL